MWGTCFGHKRAIFWSFIGKRATWMFFAPSKSRKRTRIWKICVSKTNDHIQIKIKMQPFSQEPPASSKAPYRDLKDMDVFCIFKIKRESQNSEFWWNKDQWPYPNQYQDAKPRSGTSSALRSPKFGLKGHGCSLHLQNQDREPKFRIWVYQRPVTISNSISGCKTPVRNL